MKSLLSVSCLAVLALLLTTGCAPRYKLTLTNNHVVTTHGKPKWDKQQGTVSYTDAEGKKRVVPWINVRGWEPQ
jgi:hypothetical protein